MVPGVALERHHRVDHVLDDARSGDLAVLGDMADEDHRRAAALREPDQRLRRAAHLGDGSGRRFDRLGPHRLDRVDDGERRRLPLGKRRDDVLDIGLGCELDQGVAEAEALGPKPHLRDRLLARDIDDAMPALGERGRDLHQHRRLADARIAADEDHRAAHEAAAGDAVELGKAGWRARRLVRRAGKALEREHAAFRPARARRDGACQRVRGAGLLDDRVPAAAGLAAAFPAVVDRAAALADEGGVGFGHGQVSSSPRPARTAGRSRAP